MTNKHTRIIVAGLAVMLTIGLYVLTQSGFFDRLFGRKEPIHIAVVSPRNDKNTYPQMEQAVELMVSELEDGVNGHRVIIDRYYDDEDARSVAEQIARDGRALFVLGHAYSGASLAAGEVYARVGIPAITSGATSPAITRSNEWFFSVINNNDSYAAYTALYIHDVLGIKNASVVYENEEYGRTLAEAFVQQFTQMGGTITAQKSMQPLTEDDPQGLTQAAQVVREISQQTSDPGIIFLALYKSEGADFINAMREQGHRWALFGAEDLGDNEFSAKFTNVSYLEGMYAFSPLIYDVAGLEAQEFRDKYHQTYKVDPTWFGATTYDSAKVALEAVRRAGISGNPRDLASDRFKVRNALQAINSMQTAIPALTGRIFFNENRNFVSPIAVGYFSRGKFISAPVQLQPILHARQVPNFDQLRQTGVIIPFERNFLYKTNVVYVGISINDISQVNVETDRRYTVDFYLWFRGKDSLPFDQIEFTNAPDSVNLGDPIAEQKFEDGTLYRLYRIKAEFTNSFDLKNYPFDRQALEMRFKHKFLTRETLIYVLDLLGMEQTAGPGLVSQLNQNKALIAVTDWYASDASYYIDTTRDYSTLGNPAWFGEDKNIDYSRFNARIEIVRDVIRFNVKNLLPVLFLISLAYLGLYLPKGNYGEITAIMTGTVLSVVFFHVDLSGRLNVGYTVALDYAFYGVYFILVLVTLLSIIAWHRAESDKDVRNLFLFMRLFYPAFILIGGLVLLWANNALPFG